MNAFLFPGQGSQSVGMGRVLYDTMPEAKELLDTANEILGYDLKKKMFDGPSSELTDTQFAQPAVYVCSSMYLEAAKRAEIDYQYVAGHSLGEYSALYAAGVFSFETGLRLVDRRGKSMSAHNGDGCMMAVQGLTESELADIIVPDVVMANLNTETQIVISGTEDGFRAVEEAWRRRKDRETSAGRVRFRRLRVSAAFHSPQMSDVEEIMREEITKAQMLPPTVYVIPNVTGRATKDLSEIRECLIRQITGQVRWHDSMLFLKEQGVDCCYECGSSQIMKKMCVGLPYRSLAVPEAL